MGIEVEVDFSMKKIDFKSHPYQARTGHYRAQCALVVRRIEFSSVRLGDLQSKLELVE
jgi:hypothetical protein